MFKMYLPPIFEGYFVVHTINEGVFKNFLPKKNSSIIEDILRVLKLINEGFLSWSRRDILCGPKVYLSYSIVGYF